MIVLAAHPAVVRLGEEAAGQDVVAGHAFSGSECLD